MTISNLYGLRFSTVVHPNRLKTTLPSRKLSPCNQNENIQEDQTFKKNNKEFVEPWTIEEEIALCKAFVAKSEDSVQGNGKKAAEFWREVAEASQRRNGRMDKRSLRFLQMAATPFFTQRKESSSEYLRIKERELELEERKRQEQGEYG
ncbi:hypothetical protein Tco_0138429 [Tanacetum coccineum]